MKANGLENRKVTASSQWSMFKRIKIDDNEFLRSSKILCFVLLKFIYSEKATKFCEIFTLLLTGTT